MDSLSSDNITQVHDGEALWVICTYYNWQAFRNRLNNYQLFKQHLSPHANLLTIECALGNAPFELTGSNLLQVRTNSQLWQKERLINMALDALPKDCRYVAWLDCDLLFQDASWVSRAITALQQNVVVQLFSTIRRMQEGNTEIRDIKESFASLTSRLPSSANKTSMSSHGHTGFAWAARKDELSHFLLYDACVMGGADHAMAHVFRGDLHSPCIPAIIRGIALKRFQGWAAHCNEIVRGRIGFLHGQVDHLWHGELSNRGYETRHATLQALQFDPDHDLMVNADGCWEWAQNNEHRVEKLEQYFRARKEDG